ncbi:MAG: metallophosphoesterase [Paraglaciecola sp.]|nr:metallophosphoesterase [Paraglaciecola sp.]
MNNQNRPNFKIRSWSALPLLAVLPLTGCLNSQEKQQIDVEQTSAQDASKQDNKNIDFGFIAFGDSGYHVDYLTEKQFVPLRKDLDSFIKFEKDDWAEDGRPLNEFILPPNEFVPAVGGIIESSGLYPVANAMKSYCQTASCQFSVMLGDNIYPNGATTGLDGKDDSVRFDDLFSKPFGKMGEGLIDYRIYTVLGNHDWRTSRAGALAQVEFMQSTRPFYMDGLIYTVKPPAGNGDVEIFVVDTELMLAGSTVRDAELNADGSEVAETEVDTPKAHTMPATPAEKDMVNWLDEKLKNSTAKWKFVIGHHPIWSTGGSKFEQARTLRKLILPSLCKYADIYFAGHEHSLELHEDSCDSVFGKNSGKPALLEVLSGAAAKQRSVNTQFKAYQTKTYPDNNTIYTKGMVWGFSHLQLTDDNAEITMLITPNDGSGETNLDFTYQYKRRSSLANAE